MGYASLVGPGSNFAGIDQGIDFTPTGGGFDIYAPASGTITMADQTGHHFNRTSGEAMIILQLDAPPNAPHSSGFIYFCELIQLDPAIHVGAHVNQGTILGHCFQSPGVEIGWGRDATNGFLCEIGIPTPCGQSFNDWVQGQPGGGGGGAPTQGSAGSAGFQDPLGYDDGPTDIPTGPNPGMSDPINNRPILWAQNVTPLTFGGNAFPGEKGVPAVDPTFGQLLHGSMKTVGSKNQAVPNFLIYFMWNPSTITWNYAFNTDILPQALQDNSVKNQVSFLNGQSVQFTLIFDRVYEVGYFVANGQAPKLSFDAHGMWDSDPNHPSPFTMGVQWDVRAFERLMGIYDNTTTQASGAPPNLSPSFAPGGSDFTAAAGGGSIPLANAVDVALGSDNAPVFRGYFQSGCQVRYTRFAQNMTPTRCEIDVSMISLFLPNRELISSGQGTNPYISTPTRY